MPLKLSSEEELPTVNMTSMIDVVLVLILFFMAGSQFNQNERSVVIKLPGANSLNPMMAAPKRREVQITATGLAYLDGQPVSTIQLTQRLTEMRRNYPELAVAVRADMEARQRDVFPVYSAIVSAGITNMVQLGVQNEIVR